MSIVSYFFSEPSQNRMQSSFSVLEKNIVTTNFFTKSCLPPQSFLEKPEIVGRFAYSVKDLSSNTSSLVRQLGPSSPVASLLGMTTCFNLPQGVIGAIDAVKSYFKAGEIQDVTGQAVSASDFAIRLSQALGGASYCFIRLDDVINQGFSSGSQGLSSTVPFATPIAIYGFGVLYAAFIPFAGIRIRESNRFLDRIQSVLKDGSQESKRRFIGELTGMFPEKMPTQDFYEGLGKELRKILNTSLGKDLSSFSDASLGRSLFAPHASFSSMKHALWNPGDHRKYLPYVLKNLSIPVLEGIKAHDLKKNGELITALWARKKLKEQDIYIHLGIKLKELFAEINPELVKTFTHEELGKALFTQEYCKFLPLVLERLSISSKNVKMVQDLQGNPLLIRSIWAKKKEAIHGRVFGDQGMKAISKARNLHLYELLSSKDSKDRAYAETQSEVLFQELKAGAQENRLISALYLFTGLLGAIFTGLADNAISTLGFFFCFTVMWAADFMGFKKVLESEGPVGKWDQLDMCVHLFFGVLSVTLALVLLAGATYASGGLFFPIALMIIGSVWMGVDIWAIFKIGRIRAKYQENHPELEDFLQKVSSKASFEDKEQMFHKLPHLMQKQILLAGLEKTGAARDIYASFGLQPVFTKERIQKATRTTQDLALNKDVSPITEKNCFVHPCKQLFIQNVYNQWARDGQKKILQRIDRAEGRLRSAVESVMKKVHIDDSHHKTLSAT